MSPHGEETRQEDSKRIDNNEQRIELLKGIDGISIDIHFMMNH